MKESDDDNSVDNIIEFVEFKDPVEDVKKDIHNCCRVPLLDPSDLISNQLSVIKRCLNIISNFDTSLEPPCIINEISNCVNCICSLIQADCIFKNEILTFCDTFLRNRHEIMHELFLKCLGIFGTPSDMSFKEIFNLNSNRTPDFINKDELKKEVLIIETTVTTDKGKSYQSKGRIEEGYESKYQREIIEIQNMGYSVSYITVIFDTKDPFDNDYKVELERASKMLGRGVDDSLSTKLEFVRRCFCDVQEAWGKVLSSWFTLLFRSEFVPDRMPFASIDFYFDRDLIDLPRYKRIHTSTAIYNKLMAVWPRLTSILESTALDETSNYRLRLDLITNKLKFNPERKGLLHSQWVKVITYCDKKSLIDNLDTYVGDIEIENDQASVEFFTLVGSKGGSNMNNTQKSFDLLMHPTSYLVSDKDTSFKDYNDLILANEYSNRGSFLDDPLYEEKISGMVENFFYDFDSEAKLNSLNDILRKKPFCNNIVTDEAIRDAAVNYSLKYNAINTYDEGANKILHQKPSFAYPIVNCNDGDYISFKTKNVDFIQLMRNEVSGEYTKIILSKVLDERFQLGTELQPLPPSLRDLEKALSDTQRELHRIQINNKGSDGAILPVKNLPETKVIRNNQLEIRRRLSKEYKRLNIVKKAISAIRIPTKNAKRDTTMGHKFKKEMSHFRQKHDHAVYKGVGLFDLDILKREFNECKNVMLMPCDKECPDRILDNYVAEDVKLLHQLKTDTMSDFEGILTNMMNTNIYHACAMVSRLCFTLSYFSQTAMGSDYVFCDNLGFEDTFLICKGGKKIFKTKKSKLFRVFFKTYTELENSFNRPGYNSSYQIIKSKGETYVVTPWILYDETILNDGMTFLSRTMGYCLMDLTGLKKSGDIFNECYFNILLAFHARRKTEEHMHNMRYLIVNSMSEIACIEKMLPELADHNYDFFQCYIRESIRDGFEHFAKRLKTFHDNSNGKDLVNLLKSLDIRNLFDESVKIQSLEGLTMMIYCTFLMTKAPVTQSLEQVKNLKSMLKTHKLHKSVRPDDWVSQYKTHTTSLDEDQDLVSYWNKLFEDDFYYDPKYVCLLGKFCGDYINNFKTNSELESKWDSIISRPWDEMANTSGLRGDRGKDFFGKKGYFIVYKKLLEDPNYMGKIHAVFEGNFTDFERRRKLMDLNQTFKQKLNELTLEEAIFHVVDKRQRGGSREIFVMDYKTKLHQQPIEKFMSYLCKLIPNELISIPSNRRLFHIHSNVFERFKGGETQPYNLVLDCRRWAPHSVINKFMDFLVGMRFKLPRGFFLHCMNFFDKMYSKKIYTRKYVYDILVGNRNLDKDYKEYFVEDPEISAYYFHMSYSWVMGIFNYFSSLIHVMNQMHSSQLLASANLNVFHEEFNLHMNAHSDDSGGRMQCKNRMSMRRSFLVYELLLKSSNHMLSDKKCNIGKIYFELLSILYLGNRLLSLLSKFIGSFVFHPTDSGYAADIMESYSKCIELITNGANFSQAYLALKIMSYTIWRFYFGKSVDKIYYDYPPQLTGMPDAHPINIMLSGGDADLLRIGLNSKKLNLDQIIYVSKYISNFDKLEDSFCPPIKCEPQIFRSMELEMIRSQTNLLDDEDYRWFFNNNQTNNSALNLISFLGKLGQKTFCASLQDETLTRRISRAFYFKSHDCINTNQGLRSYTEIREFLNLYHLTVNNIEAEGSWKKEIKDAVEELQKINMSDSNEFFNLLHSEVIALNKSMDNISYKPDYVINSSKTCKPIHFNMQRINSPLTNDFTPDTLTTWICHPRLRWLLPAKGYNQQVSLLEDFFNFKNRVIPTDNPNWLFRLLNKYKGRYIKEYFMHSNMPSGSRDINSYRDLLFFLAHNSFNGKYIEGIITPYQRTMTLAIEQSFQDFLNDDVSDLMNLMDFLSGLFEKPAIKNQISKLKVNIPGCDNINEVLIHYREKAQNSPVTSDMLLPHSKSLICSDDLGYMNNCLWLRNSYFHCFVKRQHLVGNIWMGKGKLYINLPSVKILLEFENRALVKVICNNNTFRLSRHEMTYIDYVLQNAQFNNLRSYFKPVKVNNEMKNTIGIGDDGLISSQNSRFHLICFENTEYNQSPNWLLANIDLCEVKVISRMRYIVSRTTDIGGLEKYVIHTFDIPVLRMFDTLQKIFNNEENRRSMSDQGKELKPYLEILIGETTNSELRVRFLDLYNNYRISKSYKIIKSIRDRGEINLKKLQPRPCMYPGQEGGFLDLLIKYKNFDNEFLFDYDNIMTPEMMYLKSTQPDAFISNLTTNIKNKYDSLYDDVDKKNIIRSMAGLMNRINDDSVEQELLSLLTTWGYVGVMGALGDFSTDKSEKSFEFFRFDCENNQIYNFSLRCLKKILSALISASWDTKVFDYLGEFKFCKAPNNKFTLTMRLISWVHSNVLSTYMMNSDYSDYQLSTENIFLFEYLNYCFSSEEFCNSFMSNFEDTPILFNVPVNRGTSGQWFNMMNTLINNVMLNSHIEHDINYWAKVYRFPDHVPQPIMKTKLICTEEMKFRTSSLQYQGTISNNFSRFLEGRKTLEIKGKISVFDLNKINVSDVRKLPINPFYIPTRPFNIEEIDEDEFYDVELELYSNEPDMDTINDMVQDEWFIEDYPRSCLVNYHGKHVKSNYYNVSIINLVGCYSTHYYNLRIIQSGITKAVFCDYLIDALILPEYENIAIFNHNERDWYNQSIIPPDRVLIYVIDSKPIEVKAWERLFDCTLVDKNELRQLILEVPYGIHYNKDGLLYNHKVMSGNFQACSNYMSEVLGKEIIEEPEEATDDSEEIKEEQEKILSKLEELQNEGYDTKFIQKYRFGLQNLVDDKTSDLLERLKLFTKVLVDGIEGHKVLKNKIKDVLRAKKTKQTLTSIYELPNVFSVGNPTRSSVKNKAMKDSMLRAEIESLSPNLCNLLLSGGLDISERRFKSLKRQITLCKTYATHNRNNIGNKKFFIDLVTLILNDAQQVENPECDSIWEQVSENMTEYIMDENEETDMDDDTYDQEVETGTLRYRLQI